MFNIPLKKERGIQAGDFVVPTAEFKAWMKDRCLHSTDNTEEVKHIMYVIDSDVMRDGKYISVLPIVVGNEKWQRDTVQKQHEKKSYTYSVDSFVRQDHPEKTYHSLGFDLGNRLSRIIYNVNDYYESIFHKRGMPKIDIDTIRKRENSLTGDDY